MREVRGRTRMLFEGVVFVEARVVVLNIKSLVGIGRYRSCDFLPVFRWRRRARELARRMRLVSVFWGMAVGCIALTLGFSFLVSRFFCTTNDCAFSVMWGEKRSAKLDDSNEGAFDVFARFGNGDVAFVLYMLLGVGLLA